MTTFTATPEFGSTVIELREQWMPGQAQPTPLQVITYHPLSLKEAPGIADAIRNIVHERSANLSAGARERIKELLELPDNWDGEGSSAVRMHALADVIEVLKRLARKPGRVSDPFLAPTFDGLVQIEWHGAKRSLEIEVVREGWSIVGTMQGVDANRHYFVGTCERSDFAKLEEFYDWFLGAELIWP